jgi:DNA-binding NarL/FixJ family response regulator
VANGDKYYSSNILETMVKASVKRSRNPTMNNPHASELTPREISVLKHIANGLNNKEIGLELKISKRTVDTHRTNIMRKLDAKNTAMIVSIAIESDLL